jgi:hypothetical protein
MLQTHPRSAQVLIIWSWIRTRIRKEDVDPKYLKNRLPREKIEKFGSFFLGSIISLEDRSFFGEWMSIVHTEYEQIEFIAGFFILVRVRSRTFLMMKINNVVPNS